MERKVTVTFEVTEQMIPVIQEYAKGLANGSIHIAPETYVDTADLHVLWRDQTPALKAILWKLSGVTLEELKQLRDAALEESANHYMAHREAQETEFWAADVLKAARGEEVHEAKA